MEAFYLESRLCYFFNKIHLDDLVKGSFNFIIFLTLNTTTIATPFRNFEYN